MERYNQSTMPVNAEKYFYDPPWDSNSRLGNTAQHCIFRHFYQLRNRDNPKKDRLNSADIGIGRFIMKIDMERYNKSTMTVNAEKNIFMTHRGILTHDRAA